MKTFFKKLFKRGDFMTRADKWYYSKLIKTWLWSAFAFVIIAWVGTNLVLCALTTNVKSGGDIIYGAPKDVVLPTGSEFSKQILTPNPDMETLIFDKYSSPNTYMVNQVNMIEGLEKTVIVGDQNSQADFYLSADGKTGYVLNLKKIYANPESNAMFAACKLKIIKFNNFDTSLCTSMRSMFMNAKVASLLGIENWDTQNVTDMTSMFYYCQNLTTLNLGAWNTSKVEDMNAMFMGCSSLTTIQGLKYWDFSGFTSTSWGVSSMFEGCEQLKSIDLSGWKNTNKITDIDSMFSSCNNLSSVNFSGWNTSNVDDMSYLFCRCYNLKTIDLSGWDTSSVKNMNYMFAVCDKLTTIYASTKFVTTKVNSSTGMFKDSTNLKGGNGTAYNANYVDKTYARIDKSGQKGYFTAK